MMSVSMKRAWKRAEEIDDRLTTYDIDPDDIVVVATEEGASHVYRYALALLHSEGDGNVYLFVFPEHEHFAVFHVDELTWYTQSRGHSIRHVDQFKFDKRGQEFLKDHEKKRAISSKKKSRRR
jgi:hypothetical protein